MIRYNNITLQHISYIVYIITYLAWTLMPFLFWFSANHATYTVYTYKCIISNKVRRYIYSLSLSLSLYLPIALIESYLLLSAHMYKKYVYIFILIKSTQHNKFKGLKEYKKKGKKNEFAQQSCLLPRSVLAISIIL